jgi:hypothetical protein
MLPGSASGVLDHCTCFTLCCGMYCLNICEYWLCTMCLHVPAIVGLWPKGVNIVVTKLPVVLCTSKSLKPRHQSHARGEPAGSFLAAPRGLSPLKPVWSWELPWSLRYRGTVIARFCAALSVLHGVCASQHPIPPDQQVDGREFVTQWGLYRQQRRTACRVASAQSRCDSHPVQHVRSSLVSHTHTAMPAVPSGRFPSDTSGSWRTSNVHHSTPIGDARL